MTTINIGAKNENQINFFFRKDKADLPAQIKKNIKKPLKFENSYILDEFVHMYIYLGKRINVQSNDFRQAGEKAYSYMKSLRINEATINVDFENEMEFKAFAEGLAIGSYEFNKYKFKSDPKDFIFYINTNNSYQPTLNEVLIINNNVSYIRDLINQSAHEVNTVYLATLTESMASKHGLKSRIIDEKELKELGMGLISAVGSGGSTPPRIAIIEYNGNPDSQNKTAIIGKGIVFDSGGLNLKPTGGIEEMKCDMAGAATVLGTIITLKELNIPVNVIGVLALAENSVDANSYKPGDVFQAYNGLFVEITNTDAEGRLVMADALSFANKNYQPTEMIDIATLTGACMVALGEHTAGVMGNKQSLVDNLLNASKNTDETMWQLPIYDEYLGVMKSDIADLKNTSTDRYAGAETAAAFLKEFVGQTNWAHIDFAGPAFISHKYEYYAIGATGFGIRTFVEYFKNQRS